MKIENYREAGPSDKYIAKFDLYIPALQMTLHELKLIRSTKGHNFIAMPSFSKEDEFGKKSWFPFIEFSKEKKVEFEKQVMELLKGFVRS